MDTLRKSDQRLHGMEDCVPLDPRSAVRFRGELDGRRFVFPLHPGDLEEPLAVAYQLLRYAEALDPLLVPALSMGIADVLEVAGRLMSAEGEALRPAWEAGPPKDVTAAPFVTVAEVQAAGRYLEGWQLERLGAPFDEHLTDDVGVGSAEGAGQPVGGLPGAADRVAGGAVGVAARLGRAVDLVTAPASRVRVTLGLTAAALGPALAVKGPAGVCPVPAAFVLEGTSAVARVLADRVLSHRPAKPARRRPAGRKAATPRKDALGSAADRAAVDQRWRRAALRDLYEVVGGVGAHVMYPVEVDVIGRELLLLVTGHRHVLAIDIVSGLDPAAVAVEVAKARRGLARLTPETRFRLPQPGKSWRVSFGDGQPQDRFDLGDLGDREARTWSAGLADALPFPPAALAGQPYSLAPGTVVDVLVLVAGPWQPNPVTGRGIPVCTVDELRSLLFDNADREEVWAFLAELADLGGGEDGPSWGFETLQAFSILDAWQLWREQGMLAPAWVPGHTLLAVRPRKLGRAWRTAADRDALDELLLAVGLPGVRSWPLITDRETARRPDADVPLATGGVPSGREDQPGCGPGERTAAALTRPQPRHLAVASVPDQLVVAGSLEFVDGLVFDRRFAATLLDALHAGLQRLAAEQPAAWAVWRQAHEQEPVRIDLTPRQEPADIPALRLLVVSQGHLMFSYEPRRCQTAGAETLHGWLGTALTTAVLTLLAPPADVHQPEPAVGEQPSVRGGRMPVPVSAGGHDQPRSSALPVHRLDPTTEARQAAPVFDQAWRGLAPILAIVSAEIPFVSTVLTGPTYVTDAGLTRAGRTVARRLAGALTPGRHPVALTRTVLCPAGLDALAAAAAARFDARALLAAACGELERTLALRFDDEQQRRATLAGPWALERLPDLEDADDSDAARHARAVELLIEALRMTPPAGTLIPDRRDITQLARQAAWPLELALGNQYAYAGLMPSFVEIDDLGDISLLPAAAPRVALYEWRQAGWEARLQGHLDAAADSAEHQPYTISFELPDAPGTAPHTGPRDTSAHPGPPTDGTDATDPSFVSLRQSLLRDLEGPERDQKSAGALLAIEDALRTDAGYGLDAIRADLLTVAAWQVPDDPVPPIAPVSREELAANIAEWSRLPKTEITSAVDACTLTAERLADEGLRYWQLEKRSARLALRPLLAPPEPRPQGELWLLPRRAHATLQLMLHYLDDGRLPWPAHELSAAVRQAVRAWRKLAEEALEDRVLAVATEAGLKARSRIQPRKAHRKGLPVEREIDLLAADPTRHRLYVIEAKHAQQPFSPPEMAFNILDMHGTGALALDETTLDPRQASGEDIPYVDRLLTTTRIVSDHLHAALDLLGLAGPEAAQTRLGCDATGELQTWEVTPVMVTAHIEVAAFVPDPRVAFVSLDYLPYLFRSDVQPTPGSWRPHQPPTSVR